MSKADQIIDVATENYAAAKKQRHKPKIDPVDQIMQEALPTKVVSEADLASTGFFQPNLQQQRFVHYILSQPLVTTNYSQVARQLKIDTRQMFRWFENPAFSLWIDQCRRQAYLFIKPLVDRALIKKAVKGDVKAMKLFFEITGDLQATMEERSIKKLTSDVGSNDTHEMFLEYTHRVGRLTGIFANKQTDVIPPRLVASSEESEKEEPETDEVTD